MHIMKHGTNIKGLHNLMEIILWIASGDQIIIISISAFSDSGQQLLCAYFEGTVEYVRKSRALTML